MTTVQIIANVDASAVCARSILRSDQGALLASMFEDRKRLFVDLLGWDVPVLAGRYEVDHFDNSAGIYIVASDEARRHAGSKRLIPTTRPHILDTLFPSLVKGGIPTGAGVFEITRLCLPARFSAAERLSIRNRLITAMVDHALERGIHTLTGVVSASFREQVLAMGWRAAPLGPARVVDGASLGAFAIEIDANTPALLRCTGIYRHTEPHRAAATSVAACAA